MHPDEGTIISRRVALLRWHKGGLRYILGTL